MSEIMDHEGLIRSLAADLRPVRRLLPPWLRALCWIGVVAALGAALASIANLGALWQRLAAVPDMWLAVLASCLTTVLAAIAAFQISLPDRRAVWALLPAPALLLWIGASGLGCLRNWTVPSTHEADARSCLVFIVGVSLPLSALLLAMLRRACPLRPNRTAILGGLAAASASATLLNLFHPYDAAATDLAVHALAVLIVILGNRAIGARVFGT
ncbi:MAG TPA: NrsF family protein [Acetobacteraceae bacterium]|nr:NrsF family protein [Acetobacteraceae bacterium]